MYYGFVALHSEKVQSCADNIHRGKPNEIMYIAHCTVLFVFHVQRLH